MGLEYYRLIKVVEEEPPEGMIVFATAAVWHCSLCHEVISGMGGPGYGTLCRQCGDELIAGELEYKRYIR